MPRLKPLQPNENCRVQILSVPGERTLPEHVAIFIEARDVAAVHREITRLGGAAGVLHAAFAEPAENPRGTYTSHGFLCAAICASRSQKRFIRSRDLPSSRSGGKR